jgi:hypothetical protein
MLQKLGSLVGVATDSWHRALQSGSLLSTTLEASGENEGRQSDDDPRPATE